MNVDADRCDLLFRFMNNFRISCSVWQERENRNDNNGAPSEENKSLILINCIKPSDGGK